MSRNLFVIVLVIAVCSIFSTNKVIAQCGADGTQPCPTKNNTPQKPSNTKKKPAIIETRVTKPKTTVQKPQTTVSKPQTKFAARAPQIEMVKISAGSFMMGSNDGLDEEKPVHRVTLTSDFYVGKYEITQAQWKAVMGNNPSSLKGDNLPVEQVSWDDVQKFIRKLNSLQNNYKYRLPTEAEWEYSCRAGSTTKYSFGDDEDSLERYAWYMKNSGNKMHPVGQKLPNAWGLYDMHGNVSEWVQDRYSSYSSEAVTNPTGATGGSGRVTRGGSYGGGDWVLLSAGRHIFSQSVSAGNFGFRVVRN